MKKYALLILSLVLLLAGCGSKEENKQADTLPVPIPIAVDLQIAPEHIEANTAVTFTAVVTQENEKVDDADEVLFEIWKKGSEDHEMIDAEHKGNGQYVIEKSFAEDGIYYVISHVTARNMHNMPKKEFVVGNAEASDDNDHHEGIADSHTEQGHDSSQHHDHSAITIQFKTEDVLQVNKSTLLTATILADDHHALLEADVQFEIWQDGDEKHFYVRATEQDGSYQATTTFEKQGKYNVRVHVLKGDLHDHSEQVVEVK